MLWPCCKLRNISILHGHGLRGKCIIRWPSELQVRAQILYFRVVLCSLWSSSVSFIYSSSKDRVRAYCCYSGQDWTFSIILFTLTTTLKGNYHKCSHFTSWGPCSERFKKMARLQWADCRSGHWRQSLFFLCCQLASQVFSMCLTEAWVGQWSKDLKNATCKHRFYKCIWAIIDDAKE